MNIYLTTMALMANTMIAWAQKPIFTQAKIEQARIYNHGAELKHKAQVSIPAGTSEVVITNVANHIVDNTVQITAPKGCTIMSVQYSNAYVEEYDNNIDSPLVKPVKEALTNKEDELMLLKNKLSATQKSIELLDKNQTINNSNSFSVLELTKFLEYHQAKRLELSNTIDKTKQSIKSVEQEINSLKAKLSHNQNSTEKISKGKLILNINSTQGGNIPLNISYLTWQSHWVPAYEIRVENTKSPMQIIRKATVYQNTGVDWKNTKLTLTSGYATRNNHAPTLNTWHIDYAPENDIEVAAVSKYAAKRMGYADAAVMEVEDEVEIVNQYLSSSENELSVSYDINLPYNILSNGKEHSISLNEMSVPASYEYISIPKVDKNVYLVAKVKDYNQYNLLTGQANVIFDGMFIGKTTIAANTNDELQISLGVEDNVVTSHKLISDTSANRIFSSKKVQDFEYEISLKNNKKQSINLVVQDQIPVSKNQDIEVILQEKNNGELNPESGELKWNLSLKPNEVKKIRFKYQLKYNKEKNLIDY